MGARDNHFWSSDAPRVMVDDVRRLVATLVGVNAGAASLAIH